MTFVGLAGVSFLRSWIFSQSHQVIRLDQLSNFIISGSSELSVSLAAFDLDDCFSLAAGHAFFLVEIVR